MAGTHSIAPVFVPVVKDRFGACAGIAVTRVEGLQWKGDIRAGFLHELSDCSCAGRRGALLSSLIFLGER